MANLDEFNLQLSGELDQQKSKTNIDSDIAKLEKAIEHLKLQAEIDPKSVQNIAKQLSDILNQKVVVDNIQIDSGKVTKTAQQVGQKIGDTVEKSVQQSLSIDDVIDKQVTDLMAKYSIAGKKGSKAFDEIRQAVINYRKELATVSDFDPDDEFSFFSNSADIRKVTSALTDHMKVADATKDTYASLVEYIKAVNNSGTKIHLPESIRQEYGDDFSSMRSQLGKAFTTGKGGDFESFITELNGQLGNVIDMSQGAEAAFGDLVQKVNSAKGGNFLSGDELFKQGYLDRNEIERDITSAIDIIEEEEKKLAQVSTTTANTVVQNEQKKKQAYQQTANVQKTLTSEESVIKSGVGVRTFDSVKEAQEYFKGLLRDEQAVIATTERFGQNNNLTSFTVNIKRATGEVESLRYAVDKLTDDNGNVIQTFYRLSGSTTGDSGAIKQIKDIENAFSDYTAKLSQFKSTNSEILSGLTTPLSDFETKLAGLKNGTSTIDEVTNAYKSLNAEASNITKNFSRQLSPIDSAIRNLAKGEETISGLRAEFKGLNNAPKEINTELNKCARLLENVKKIESQEGRTENWSQAYRQWSDSVDTLQAKLKTLRKEQSNVASTQIFNTSDLKNNNIAYMSKVYNTIEKQMVEINRLAKAKDWQIVDVSGVEQADGKIKKLTLTVRDAEGALKKLDMQREKLQGNGKAQYGLMQVGDVKILETASQAMDQLAKRADDIQLSTDVTKLTTDYQKFGVVSQEVENNLKELKLAQEAVVNAKGTDRLAFEIEKYNQKLAETKSSLKELTTTQVSLNQRTSQMTSMQEWMRKNKNATKLVGDQVKQLIEECKTCDSVRFNGIKNEFKKLQVEAGKAGKLGNSLFGGLIEQGKKFVQWIGVTGTVMRGIQIGKDMIQDVKDLDDSLLELSKVSDLSTSGLEKVTEQAYELGEKVARTGREVIDATTEFKRAGFDMQQSMDMAESAMVMTNVAENITDTADAAGTLISVLKGFNMDASETMTIVDKINQVSNTSPIGFDNIAEGLERTAGTMAQSGNTIDQTIGLITAGYAQLRNVEKVSTGLITLSARLRGVDEEGETIDGLSAKLQEDFGKIGVAIENADGSLRSIYEIAQDYSKVLPTLSDKQKQYYAELAAGKRQVTVWNAITQQFQDAEYAVNQSLNSQNSALDENQKKLDSIGGHVKSFESAMEHLSSTVVESDLIKFFVDLGTTGVKAIDGIVNALTPLGTIGLGAGLFAGFKNAGIFRTIKDEATGANQSIGLFGKSFGELKTILSSVKTNGLFKTNIISESDISCIEKYNASIKDGIPHQQAMEQATKGASDAIKQMIKNANGNTIALDKMTLGAKAASVGLKALSIAGNMLMFWAITEGIQLVVKALDKLILTTEEAKEALDNSVSSFQGTTDELNNLESELETTSDRLRELQKLEENNSISIAEERELELLKQQNDELERKIALKKEEQVDAAKQVLKDAKKYSDKEVMSSYAYVSGTYEQGAPQYDSISAADELSIAFDKYYSSTNRPSANQQNPKDVIENMYAVIEPTIEAYEALIDADYKLSNEEQAHYDKLRSLQDRYLQYRYDLNGLKETYQALSIEQQKNILLNKLTAQGLSDIQANAVLDSVSESDYASLWEKGFSFTPPQMTDYATAEEYGKAYANAWLNGVKSGVDAANETDILSFSDAWEKLKNSTDDATKGIADNLTELAEKGQLTVEALSEADTTDFFKNAGISAEEAVKKINELVSASTQLQSMSAQISKMSDMLADKKNGTIASASDLAGFDAEVRGLDSWKEFESVMGSTTSTMEECQAAANALATEWVNDGNFLSNLTDENKAYYETQLDQMGVANAQEVITDALARKHEEEAIEEEYAAAASQYNAQCKDGLNAVSANLAEVTAGEITMLQQEGIISADTAEKISVLAVKKAIANGTTLDTSGDIRNLANLAGAATQLGRLLESLAKIKQGFTNGMPSDVAAKQAEYYQKQIEAYLTGGSNKNIDTNINLNVNPKGSRKYKTPSTPKKSKSESAKKTSQEFNLIEILINNINRSIDKLDAKISNTWSSWSKRNKALISELNQVKKLENTQTKAANYYKKKASNVKLDSKTKKQLRDGAIDIKTVKDEKLANKMQKYQDYWESYKQYTDDAANSAQKYFDLLEQKFDDIQSKWDSRIGYQENRKNAVSDALNLAQSKGKLIGSAYYTKQKGINNKEINKYKQEETELKKAMKNVPKYSEQWYQYKADLSEVHSKYVQLQADNAELQNSINELKFDRFDELINKFDDIIDESDFLIGLLDSDNLFNSDNGSITNDGITAMGLTAQNYDVYLAEAEEYKNSIADLEQMYENGEIGISDYNSKMRELQGGYRDSIKSANDAKKAVIDYVKQGLDAQNQALEEAVNKQKELLQQEKD